ncbi:MAG: methyltransferase domain-containing protein [Thermoleophilia bacterium]
MSADPLVAFFDRRARAYDRQLWLERRALRTAARLAEPLAGARVVDLATGTGALAAALIRRDDRIARLTGVDAAPQMLDRARPRVAPLGQRAGLVRGDVRQLPLPDADADVVTIGYLLHLLAPTARAQTLAEALRVLRPGGRLVAVVHGSPPGRAGRAYRGAWRGVSRIVPSAVIGEGPMADLAPVVADAGFRVEATVRLSGLYWSQVLQARRPEERSIS